MSEQSRRENQTRINEIIESVLNIEDPNHAIDKLLGDFGSMIGADRTYIFEMHKDQIIVNTYEWCAPGVTPEISQLQAVPISVYERTWQARHERGEMIIIRDMEQYHKEDPYVYDMLKEQNIQRLISAPMFVDKRFIGFVGIDNPPKKDMADDAEMAHMISSFLGALIRHRDNLNRIHKLSERDIVTNSYNMIYFLQRMRSEIARGFAGHTLDKTKIIYFNISQFKVFNDAYGFEEGNTCLRKISYLLMEVFDTENVSRFSSDHFIVFYFKDDVEAKIKEAHDRCYRLDDRMHLWLEAGLVIPRTLDRLEQYCDDGKVAADAIAKDGIQYYKQYSSEMGEAIVRKKYLQDSIDDALARGDVKVYYQPVIRTVSGYLCNFEALSRWVDGTYGMISPAEFIPALEEKHLCYKLDFYVIEQVCRTIRERLDRKEPVVPVSVNLSRRDFIVDDPVEEVDQLVNRYHLDHSYLAIEITESAVMEDPKMMRSAINRFHELGYQVWMDDFGSAYSSLNTLKDFPFDEIKIDMAFMRNFNEKSQAILRDVVHMSKSLGIHSLCEGVETREQLDYLRDIGCERIQGFYYGRPLPLEEQLSNLADKGIGFETEEEGVVANQAGLEQFQPEEAFALVANNGGELKTLYANHAFGHLLTNLEDNAPQEKVDSSVNAVLNDRTISFGRLVHKMTYEASLDKRVEKLFAMVNGHSCMFECRNIADFQEGCIEKIRGTDITDTENDEKFGYFLRCVAGAYNEIYFINRRSGEMQVIRSMIPGERVGDTLTIEDGGLIGKVDVTQRRRFLRSMQTPFRDQMIAQTGRESYTENYRLIRPDGSYQLTAFTTISINYQGENDFLLCVKPAALPDAEEEEQWEKVIAAENAGQNNSRTQESEAAASDGGMGSTSPASGFDEVDKAFLKETGRKAGRRRTNGAEASSGSAVTAAGGTGSTSSGGSQRSTYPAGSLRFAGRTELLEQLMYLNQKVYTDHLTGVRNRRFYDEQVTGRVVQAMAVIEVNHFSSINDNYGHQVGDTVLRQMARAIANVIRTTDTLVRYDGDEFVIAFERITEEAFRKRLEQIQWSAGHLQITTPATTQLQITVSIGGCYGKGSAEQLVMKASDALYKAKVSGKGKIEIVKN